MIKLGPLFTYADLVSVIGEEEIAKRYIPGFEKINKSFRLRSCGEDKKPSCRVYPYGNKLFINDFGDSKHAATRTIFSFIQDEYSKSAIEALDMIATDFKYNIKRDLTLNDRSKPKSKVSYIEKETVIQVKYRNWEYYDINYWSNYGITVAELEFAGIKPISYFWIDSKRVNNKIFKAEKLAYTYDYYVHKGIFRRKIYQPLSSWMKWVSNCSLDVVQNYRNLPKQGELLIIQSSLKDALTMNTFGYNSIAPISESTFFLEDYYAKLISRFKKILYFSDNDWNKQDNSGLGYGKQIEKKYKINIIYIDSKYECSDISEFRAKYGKDCTEELLKTLIKI